jgi:hypothetical protein
LLRHHLGRRAGLVDPARLACTGALCHQEEAKTSYDNCLYLQAAYLPGLAYLVEKEDDGGISRKNAPLGALCSTSQL